MVRFTVDNRNRLIFYGNPVGYVKADTAVVDEMFRTDELNQYLRRMNLTPRWEDGIFDRLVSGEVTGEELAQSRKGCRIWQLKKDVDVAMRFIGYEDQVRKFGEPDAENYTLVLRHISLVSSIGMISPPCVTTKKQSNGFGARQKPVMISRNTPSGCCASRRSAQ